MFPIPLHTGIPSASLVHFIGEPCRCIPQTDVPRAKVPQPGVCNHAGVFYIQLFSTQVGFHSAVLQRDVIQSRCLPWVFLHIRADFFTRLFPCRCVPHQCFFIRGSPSRSAPDRSASHIGDSMPRVSPHLDDSTDVPAVQVRGPFYTCALPLLFTPPDYEIGFPLQVRPRRGPAPAWPRPFI